MRPFTVLVLVLAVAAPGIAAPPPGSLERVLLPVFTTAMPGAYGSTWSTELWGLIDSDAGLHFFPVSMTPVVPGTDDLPAPLFRHVLIRLYTTDSTFPGPLLYIDSSIAAEVHLSLRLTGNGSTADRGVNLPVVPERSFVADTIQLLAVPHTPNVRLTLRAYALDAPPVARVRVRVFDGRLNAFGNDTLLGEMELTLTESPDEVTDGTRQLPAHAAAVQVDIDDAFPGITTDLLRIEIEPTIPTLKVWCFATATDNVTQQVSLVTP